MPAFTVASDRTRNAGPRSAATRRSGGWILPNDVSIAANHRENKVTWRDIDCSNVLRFAPTAPSRHRFDLRQGWPRSNGSTLIERVGASELAPTLSPPLISDKSRVACPSLGIRSSSRQYVLIQHEVSPTPTPMPTPTVRRADTADRADNADHSVVWCWQSSEIGPNVDPGTPRSSKRLCGPIGLARMDGSIIRKTVRALLLALLVVGQSSGMHTPQPFVISNALDQGTSAKDYFIGPCLVNTNQTCPDDEVTFFLYTRRNTNEGQQILVDATDSNLPETNFVPSNPTKILIHGYDSDMQLSYLVDVRMEYLKSYNYNVISVDWHRLANAPCYPIVVRNVPHVGDCLAQLIDRLKDMGATDIHAIGFSLGAHVPAFAANALRPYRISRITGLDPAMPLFVTVDKDHKLDAGDAEFVDVFHTNAFIQGKVEMSGHVDFYMNGGINQPGCWEIGRPFECDHHRSVMYFAESINSKPGFWGWHCGGLVSYLLGMCPPRYPAILAGDRVERTKRGFVLVRTNSHSPFALGNFSVNQLDMYT